MGVETLDTLKIRMGKLYQDLWIAANNSIQYGKVKFTRQKDGMLAIKNQNETVSMEIILPSIEYLQDGIEYVIGAKQEIKIKEEMFLNRYYDTFMLIGTAATSQVSELQNLVKLSFSNYHFNGQPIKIGEFFITICINKIQVKSENLQLQDIVFFSFCTSLGIKGIYQGSLSPIQNGDKFSYNFDFSNVGIKDSITLDGDIFIYFSY